jgi:hypothetical protein
MLGYHIVGIEKIHLCCVRIDGIFRGKVKLCDRLINVKRTATINVGLAEYYAL